MVGKALMAVLLDGLKQHSHRFGNNRFRQSTLLGMLRWLILSLTAYLIADWTPARNSVSITT